MRRRSRPTDQPAARRPLVALRVFAALLLAMASTGSVSAAEGFNPRFTRVMVVVIENQSLEDILEKNPAAKYILNELTPAGGLAMKFYAPKRNSPTAYFALSSGYLYTEGDGGGHWAGKCGPTAECSSDDETVYEQLTGVDRSWRIYSEDQTEPCLTKNVEKYWVGHNPAVWYTRLGPNSYTETGDGSCLLHDVSFNELSADIQAGTVPEYSMVVPNNCNNMHDSCYPLQDRVMQGNAWMSEALGKDAIVPGGLIKWAQENDTLLIVTFDEARLDTDREGCCPYVKKGGGGHIPTWVLGPPDKVKVGYRSEVQLSNYSVLKHVQQNFDLPLLGHAADDAVDDLGDFLIKVPTQQPITPPNPKPAVNGAEPTAGATAAPQGSGGNAPAASGSAAGPSAAATPVETAPLAPTSSGGPSLPTLVAGGLVVIGLALVAIRSMMRATRRNDTPH
jgi:phosphatidylinositol-3-phosphatase